MIGIIPLLALHVLEEKVIRPNLPVFGKRLVWFLERRRHLFRHVGDMEH